jgi:predicted GNAT family acetyltransferase
MAQPSETGLSVVARDDRPHDRLVLDTPGGTIGQLRYRIDGDRFLLLHAEVRPDRRNHGYAGQLVAAAVAVARQEALTVVPRCSYVRRWLCDHPEATGAVTVDWVA